MKKTTPARVGAMSVTEGTLSDDGDSLRHTLEAMPSSVVTVDAAGRVNYRNTSAATTLPTLVVGSDFRETLEQIVHPEKVDRLLIRREVTSFPAVVDGPELHWMVWDIPETGGLLLTAWETDFSLVMNERRASFMMAASHELRGPLTTLRGFAEILNMDTGNMTPQQAEAAAIVERTARHLTLLVEDVFDLSRNSFGELRLNLCRTNLEDVVQSVVSEARPRVAGREQTLDLSIEGPIPEVEADRARATQMITNLVNNASIHNPDGTSIRVIGGVEAGQVRITVEDDGDGLPFEDPEEAFRTFRRGEHTIVGDRTGSGIGLSITKRLIELHRGKITVESTPGTGTRFTLWFPVDRSTALTPGKPGPA